MWEPVLEQIRSLAGRPDAPRGDGELLSQFVARADEAAFEALLRRHGPMVLRVARRVLGGEADAEDVFQATFLLLARRAGAIRKRESVASWLHGVAHRLALSVRGKNARRRERERRAAEARPTETPAEEPWVELERTLHDAIARLPAKYRTPLVCCYLEGRTQEEVARDLGAPLGTVRSWVARGRELLRKQLLRRGISLSAGGAGAALLASACARAEAVPPALLLSTANAARLLQRGENAMTLLSPHVSALVRQGMTGFFLAKIKSGVVCLLVLAFAAVGMGWAAHRRPNAEAEKSDQSPPKAAVSEERPRTDAHGDPLPPGAIARLGTIRFRHENWLHHIALSPDGQTLAAVAGQSVAFWDISTGRLTRRLTFERDMHCLAFAPDGKAVAVGGQDCIVRLLDFASGKELQRFVGHRTHNNFVDFWQDSILGVTFSPDGRTLITWGSDETARRWEARSGKELRQLSVKGWRSEQGGKYFLVHDVATNGQLLAVAKEGSPKVLQLVVAATGKAIGQLPHPADVRRAAFSPDGKTLAVPYGTIGQPGRIALWDVESGKLFGTLTGPREAVFALAFSPDGKKLASAGNEATIRLWDVDARKEEKQIRSLPSTVHQLAFTPDGKTLICQGAENRIRLWDVANWRERLMADGPTWLIRALAYSADGELLASASGNTIWLWRAATDEVVRSFEGHGAPVTGVAFSANATALVSGSEDGTIRIWDAKTGKEQHRLTNKEHRIELLALSPDGATLAAWGSEKPQVLILWQVRTPEEQRAVEVPSEHPGAMPWLHALYFTPDGKTLVASSGTHINILRWDTATGNVLPSIGKHDGGLWGIAPSPDGRSIAALTMNGTLYLWETTTRQPRLVEKNAGYADSVAFSPDGRLLALGNTGYHYGDKGIPLGIENREQVRLVRAADGKVIRRFAGHLGGIACLSFAPDGRTLASGGHDTTVLVWDVQNLGTASAKEEPSLDREKLAAQWDGLRSTASEAYGCMNTLISAPAATEPFLGEKLKPVVAVDAARFAALRKKLESDEFREREEAAGELKKLGDAAEPALRKALQENLTLETRRRLQALLEELQGGDTLRSLRAIEVLERIGDASACELLRRLSAGAEGAWLTEEARRTLRRLERRDK
jgi:RNA polymerase sigma factor (sigma-70 family)